MVSAKVSLPCKHPSRLSQRALKLSGHCSGRAFPLRRHCCIKNCGEETSEALNRSPFEGHNCTGRRTFVSTATQILAAASYVASSASKAEGVEGVPKGRRSFPALPTTAKVDKAPGAMRVYLISDIHTDYEENLQWVRDLSPTSFLDDAIIVAGDITDSIPLFKETFRILRPKFAHVFFTPGNHDLWLRDSGPPPKSALKPESTPASDSTQEPSTKPDSKPRSEPASEPTSKPRSAADSEEVTTTNEPPVEDSISKLRVLFRICEELGVETRPKFLKVAAVSGRNDGGSNAPENGLGLELAQMRDVGTAGTDWQHVEWERKEEGSPNGAENGRRGSGNDVAVSSSIPRTTSAERLAETRQTEGLSSDSASPENKRQMAAAPENGGLQRRVQSEGVSLKSGMHEQAGTSSQKDGFAGERGGVGSGKVASVKERSSDTVVDVLRPGIASTSVDSGQSIGGVGQPISDGGQPMSDGHQPPADASIGSRRKAQDGRDGFINASGDGCCSGVWVVPILSWHHMSFDTEPDIPGYKIPSIQKVAKDYKVCKWPAGWDQQTDSVAREFDAMNADLHRDFGLAATPDCHVITFSHFLPRLELIPEKRFLFYPNLAKAVGSHVLEARVRAIHRDAGAGRGCHAFGHTHFNWDATLDGIRYVQAPLAYPRERKRRMNGGEEWLPLCLYDSSRGGVLAQEVPCHWSEYYKTHPREPENFEFAEWVAGLWKPIRKEQAAAVS